MPEQEALSISPVVQRVIDEFEARLRKEGAVPESVIAAVVNVLSTEKTINASKLAEAISDTDGAE